MTSNGASPSQLEALKRFGTATIHEAQGQKGAVDGAIRALDPGMRVAGPALTVKCRPGDNLALHYALTKLVPGQVLVVDAEGFVEAGPWGDVMSCAAMQRGAAGLMIDGSVRDSHTIVEMGFPVFSRGISIKGTNKRQPGQIGVPVVFGSIVVRPGDVVVGDRDGVVVVLAEEVAHVVDACQAREDKEEKFREQLRSGKTTVELLDLGPLLHSYGMD
ncbi:MULTISPECIES: 4-carboxy-4-hydroxy-2-oxoadipate aldolase/oxaloacetate decarboxylase [unclassified Variovorax]|uniref:4-carboxy-4-hydroxy-2-oxoadipate aldolase/oxaloacetate decarboxylase n=1 Tax=unclassified Variovorax TaxID=663243 RepID=UPI001BD22D32|nr:MULTISPECIES: 4-carboxy-4-hydroxy-2-oxoadipate aldolase/oxaloacetate decarboxylase [unclassified Variovorax]